VAFLVTLRFSRRIPATVTALLAGLAATVVTGGWSTSAAMVAFSAPEFTMPTFTIAAILAISVPLAFLEIGAQNAEAIGVLYVGGYKPPINAMTAITGLGSVAAALLGGHNANIAGPMTAICASDQAGEDKSKRYSASVINGIIFIAFGLLSGIAIPYVLMLPTALIAVVAGLAMLNVLLFSFQHAFLRQSGHQLGAIVALLVALSEINILGIGASFWSLVLGALVSLLLEPRNSKRPTDDEAAKSAPANPA